MLKLNLLPGSQRKQGTVQSAALAVLLIWLVLLAVLGAWAFILSKSSSAAVTEAESKKPDTQQVDLQTAAGDAYKAEDAKIQPETAFMNAASQEPLQIAQVMRDVAHGTENGMVVESYTITPSSNSIQVTALALNAIAYNRARLTLYRDPDFIGVPAMSAFNPGGGAATAAGGSSAPAGPTPIGGSAAGGSGAFFYPKNKYPYASTVTLTLTLAHPVSVPSFAPSSGPAASAGPGAGPPGYPSSGSTGYPSSGSTGYPPSK